MRKWSQCRCDDWLCGHSEACTYRSWRSSAKTVQLLRDPATSHNKGRVFWSEAITRNATTRSVVVAEFGAVNKWSIPAVEKMTSCWKKWGTLKKKDLESFEESLFWMDLRKLRFDTPWSTSFRWWFWGLSWKEWIQTLPQLGQFLIFIKQFYTGNSVPSSCTILLIYLLWTWSKLPLAAIYNAIHNWYAIKFPDANVPIISIRIVPS